MGECTYECDVAVIGGSMGGVAAALAAAETGADAVLTENTDWLGGQITGQGVSALDEHRYIESFGGTRSYYGLRNAIRVVYHERYGVPAKMLDPGNGWVFETQAGTERPSFEKAISTAHSANNRAVVHLTLTILINPSIP